LRVLCDTGPIVAATDRRDPAHDLAGDLLRGLGRDLVIPDPVVSEADGLVRARVGDHSARLLLSSISQGEHRVMFLTPGLLRRAVEIDALYAPLELGFTDAVVMACAERHDLPILTFDFRDFRATAPESGEWRLVVDESRYREAVGG
jgi:hypothetical protein